MTPSDPVLSPAPDARRRSFRRAGRRCAGLGRIGCARLIQPHSRLLSTEGVDAALRFAGGIAAPVAAGTR